jgi:hypothetical protein
MCSAYMYTLDLPPLASSIHPFSPATINTLSLSPSIIKVDRGRIARNRSTEEDHVWCVGVQERRGPAGGERCGVGGRRRRRGAEAEGAGAHAERAGGALVRAAGVGAAGARVGALLRRPVAVPVPQARRARPHLPPCRLQQVLLRPHVRHRGQEPRVVQGCRHLKGSSLLIRSSSQ